MVKIIKKLRNGNREILVRYHFVWEEYVCELHVNGIHYEPADYYTTDKQDALDTATKMVNPVYI